jgi:hypothetical protein
MAPKQELDFHPQLLARPETHLDGELMGTSEENPPAEAIQSVLELVMRLAPAMWQPPPVMLQENSLGKAIQLLPEMVRRDGANRHLPAMLQENSLAPAHRRLPEGDLDLRRTEQRSVRVRLLAARARLQDLRLREAPQAHFPLLLALAPRHSPGLGRCASSPKILVVRKCNRAARCGDRPIFAQYRPLNNRRALAGCDNRCSRSQRKHARRARTFPIAALDRYRCLPHRIAD